MIIDRIESLPGFLPEGTARLVLDFLAGADGVADGRHDLAGSDLFALVSTYTTRAAAEVRPEAHRRYVDLQVVLNGREWLEWTPVGGLASAEAYDPERDVEFFERPVDMPGRVVLSHGLCALLFPGDAHAPGIAAGGPARVRKAVFKIAAELLQR